ncbi:putative 2OG-Fe(II) oxygenase [Kangiella aquimarina]|uniref:2OG-Fe(II) oxygenase n=1 Tax=Kangiella aquimarina TaxID=261965 RepID=A0ABZ0X617_9GAMM|nr:putative 2OG-Fe(II) oxygenase [Kangiella aquimarina]WQG85965.1 putative 2OG-Fe(II) oxygenase [Kangiella aquimarina]
MIDKLNIQPVFSVPIIEATYSNHEQLNPKLRQIFLKAEKEKEKFGNKEEYVQKNENVFESRFDLFSWNNPEISSLRDFCWASLYQAIGKLNNYDLKTLEKLHMASSSWFHVTKKGGFFGVHNHANSAWSGVYCVDEGDQDDESIGSGLLSFLSPNMATTSYVDMSCSNLSSQYSRGNLQFKLKPGQLIMFPSWLLHEVKPYFGTRERITVAFNAWFKYSGEIKNR